MEFKSKYYNAEDNASPKSKKEQLEHNEVYQLIQKALPIIQKECATLENLIDSGKDFRMFRRKIAKLIPLGNLLLELKELYTFNIKE